MELQKPFGMNGFGPQSGEHKRSLPMFWLCLSSLSLKPQTAPGRKFAYNETSPIDSSFLDFQSDVRPEG